MKIDAAISILEGNIQAIDQGIALIDSLSDEQYNFIFSPYVKSTIGQHFRHVVDMFRAVISESLPIDYDTRRRGASVETVRGIAIEELLGVRIWMLDKITDMPNQTSYLNDNIFIQSEVAINETRSVEIPSNRLRELVFASSHAVHHYALISVVAKLQGVSLDENLGVAPATATFLRNESETNDEKYSCAQ